MKYTKEEKTFILNYYLECTDINLKLILHKLLLDAGILKIRFWEPGDSIPVFKTKE